MVRLAPSASNKQPWRILKKENEYHIFLKETKGYANTLGFNIQKVDIGIAMCHFEMTAGEAGMDGHFVDRVEQTKDIAAENLEYIVSWIE